MNRFPKYMANNAGNKIMRDRKIDELREIEVKLDFTPNALASVLYKQGDTVVLISVTKADSLPRWFPRNTQNGWINAEYSLLPGSTNSRYRRERNGVLFTFFLFISIGFSILSFADSSQKYVQISNQKQTESDND